MMTSAYTKGTLISDRYRLDANVRERAARSAWTAVDERSQRRVAIEIVGLRSGEDAGARRRRLRQAKGAAALRHPAIVNVQELIEAGAGAAAFVMDFHAGETLHDRLARAPGPMPVEDACRILLPVATALVAAQSVGIVHGDLAPDDIVLVTGSTGSSAKVKGFGVAALLEGPGAPAESADRLLCSAPELLQGGSRADLRADVWSLGMILYRCLTGGFPFHADTPEELVRALRDLSVAPIERQAPGVPADLAALVKKMLSVAPGERPTHLHEIRDVLASHAGAADTEESLEPHKLPSAIALDSPALSDSKAEELLLPAAAGLVEARERVQSQSASPPPLGAATVSVRPGGRSRPEVKSLAPVPVRDDEAVPSLGSRVGGALLLVHGVVWALTGSAGVRGEVWAPPALMAVIGLGLLVGTQKIVDAARVGAVVLGCLFAIAEGVLVDGDYALLQAFGYAGAVVCFIGRPVGAGGLLGCLVSVAVCIAAFMGARSLGRGELSWLQRAMMLRGHILPDPADGINGEGYRMALPRGTWYAVTPPRAQKTHEWIRSMVVRPDRAAFIAVAEMPPQGRLSSYDRMKLVVESRSSLLGSTTGRARFLEQWGLMVDGQQCRSAHIETVERGLDIECEILVTGVTQDHASFGRPLLLIAGCAPRSTFRAVSEEMRGIFASLSLKE